MERNDFHYVDALVGILAGVVVAVWHGDEHSHITTLATMVFAIFFYASLVYLMCRFISSTPPKWMLAVSFGAAITGFWQMLASYAGGLDNMVIALGSAIGAMLAWHALARKSSPA